MPVFESYIEDRVYYVGGLPGYYTVYSRGAIGSDPKGDRMTFAEIRRQANADHASRMAKTRQGLRAELSRIRRMDPATLRRYEPVMRGWQPRDPPPPWARAHVEYLVRRLEREYRDRVSDLPFIVDAAARARAGRSYLRLKKTRRPGLAGSVLRATRWLFGRGSGLYDKYDGYDGLDGYARYDLDDRRIAQRDMWILRARSARSGTRTIRK